MENGFQQLFDKLGAVELSTKTNCDTIAVHSKELSNHSQRFDALDAKFVSLENKIETEIASVNSKLIALEDNLVAKLSVSHTVPSIPSFASTPIAGSTTVSSSADNTVINVTGTMTGSGSPNVSGGVNTGTSVVSHTVSSATVTAGNVSTTTVPSATGLVTSPTAQVPTTPGLHPINLVSQYGVTSLAALGTYNFAVPPPPLLPNLNATSPVQNPTNNTHSHGVFSSNLPSGISSDPQTVLQTIANLESLVI